MLSPIGLPGARQSEPVWIVRAKSVPCLIPEQDLLQVLGSHVTVEDVESQ